MTNRVDFEHAQERLTYVNCFWASDAMIHGDKFANQQVVDCEEELRVVAGEIISQGITGFIPKKRTVQMYRLEKGLIDLTRWEVYAYSDYDSSGKPHSVELREIMI